LALTVLSFTLVLLFSGRAFADEAQKAWLRMNATDSTYVGPDPDPWITESYVVYSSDVPSISLDVTVENFKGDRDVYEIVLLIVTNDTSVISSIDVDGSSVPLSWIFGPDPTGPAMYTDPGPIGGILLGDMPAHGVYNDPTAAWVEYRSGEDLTAKDTPGDSIVFTLTVDFTSSDPGNVKIHLDTYGWTYEGSGKDPVIIDDSLDAVFAPFSKDITIIIPGMLLSLVTATSLGFGGYLLFKRKLAKT